jgi:hypothetical protein
MPQKSSLRQDQLIRIPVLMQGHDLTSRQVLYIRGIALTNRKLNSRLDSG